MRVDRARQSLLLLWMGGTAVPALVVFLQTLIGRYGDDSLDAWTWLLPSVMPTLGLMIAVTLKGRSHTAEIPRFAVLLCGLLSASYLALVAATILLQPFSRWTAVELFKLSHLWLAPTQAVLDATIASVFLSHAYPRATKRAKAVA